METQSSEELSPIKFAIDKFEKLREQAPSFTDAIYLDGVLAVLESSLKYEEDYIAQILKPTDSNDQEGKWYKIYCESVRHSDFIDFYMKIKDEFNLYPGNKNKAVFEKLISETEQIRDWAIDHSYTDDETDGIKDIDAAIKSAKKALEKF